MRVRRAMTIFGTGRWFLRCIVLPVLVYGLSGCGGSGSSPTPLAPSLVPPQAAPPPPSSGSWLAGYTLTGVSLSGVVYESTPAGGRRSQVPSFIVNSAERSLIHGRPPTQMGSTAFRRTL